MSDLDPNAVPLAGLPLAERVRLHLSQGANELSGATRDHAAADHRLRLWRGRPPFATNPGLWRDRLAADGIDEDDLLTLLSRVEGDVAVPESLPGWVESPTIREPISDGEKPDLQGPFLARAASGLLTTVRADLLAEVEKVALSVPPGAVCFDPVTLTDQLCAAMPAMVHRMLSRTLTLELHLSRERGELVGDTGEERFSDFLRRIAEPGWSRDLFLRYPVLTRQLTVLGRQCVEVGRTMAERMQTDTPLIEAEFNDGAPIGAVRQVELGAGDRHRGGQSVAIVHWSSGLTVVYKPRSLRSDRYWADLLRWLNSAAAAETTDWLPLRSPTVIDRGDYGWSEFIRPEPSEDDDAVRRFYRRAGELLALVGLLRADDMHAENLIAAGEHPILVDLETLFQPESPIDDVRLTVAERAAVADAERSVLQAGLLPSPTWHTRDGRSADISGLGRRPDAQTPMKLAMLTNVGTDTMRVETRRVPIGESDHRPVTRDAELDLLTFGADVIAGYTTAHRLCRRHREELIADDGPLQAFAGAPVRVLVRSTMPYAMVLLTGFHPDVLRDGLDRDRHFDHLRRDLTILPGLAPCVPAEQRDLWNNDIPVFETTADGRELFDSTGTPLPGVRLEPGLGLVCDALRRWDERHLAGQVALIEGSLGAAAINIGGALVTPSYPVEPDPPDMARPRADLVDRLATAATTIGDRLAADAYVRDGSAQWLGMFSQGGKNWALGPLGPDLFNGLGGVALFLAELGRAGGESRHTDLARSALATIERQVEREAVTSPLGMAGLPGVCYTLCRLAILLDDESLVDRAAAIVADLAGVVGADDQYDIVSGAAGTIGSLRILHRLRPDGLALDVISACAEHLCTSARPQSSGCGWLPASMAEAGVIDIPPAGFGHGNAGIAWALCRAADLVGERRYESYARDAVAWERTLFEPESGHWRDVRVTSVDTPPVYAWCHGAVGIGLSRATSPHLLDSEPTGGVSETEAALAATRRAGFGSSHSLCHGDLGALELFLTTARRADDTLSVNGSSHGDLAAEADRWAGGIVDTLDAVGPICGVPLGRPTPSLMVGLAGIGYGLLRAAAPDGIPSVLTLEPDSAATASADASSTTEW